MFAKAECALRLLWRAVHLLLSRLQIANNALPPTTTSSTCGSSRTRVYSCAPVFWSSNALQPQCDMSYFDNAPIRMLFLRAECQHSTALQSTAQQCPERDLALGLRPLGDASIGCQVLDDTVRCENASYPCPVTIPPNRQRHRRTRCH